MVLKQMCASVCVWELYNDREAFRTKSESQLRGAHLQLASRKGENHWNDSWNLGPKNQSKYKDLCNWTKRSEVIISHSHTFIPSFDVLSLKTFFVEASAPSDGVQATCPRVLYLEGILSKEWKDWRHQSSRVFSEWPISDHMYSPRLAILAGPWGPMIDFTWSCDPDLAAHMIVNFLQNYMTEAGERQPKESNGEIV